MNDPVVIFLKQALAALALPADLAERVLVTGTREHATLPSAFAVTDFAVASIAAAGAALSAFIETASEVSLDSGKQALTPSLKVDRHLASRWFATTILPDGWQLPSLRDEVMDDYATRDGWIRLHTNAPHHKAAALNVLQCAGQHGAVAEAVAKWDATALETAIVEAGGCAAAMRDHAAWLVHPQGAAVAKEPLIAWSWTEGATAAGAAALFGAGFDPARPLQGVKVLDLTRVFAGPVATRFLAGYGAQVLRLDPERWNEPGTIPEMTLGKRCARIDLSTTQGRHTFEALLSQADVLVHGYRPDALNRLGLGEAYRRRIRPGLVDVSLNAYGWTGPWRGRRGFDSLMQNSSGIAEAGMRWKGGSESASQSASPSAAPSAAQLAPQSASRPVPLPVQALDHATGYLLAAAVLRGLIGRVTHGAGSVARLSLARTAHALLTLPAPTYEGAPIVPDAKDYAETLERTEWGPARRCLPPLTVDGAPMAWSLPASSLGSATASWDGF